MPNRSRRRNRIRRRNRSLRRHSPPPQPISANRYVYAALTPLTPTPSPPVPYDHHLRGRPHAHPNLDPSQGPVHSVGGRRVVAPLDNREAVIRRSDFILKKETLRIEPDEKNPNRFLVSFTFDAKVTGRITIIFFAKEKVRYRSLNPMRKNLLAPVTVHFQQGLGQKFRQSSGTGIDFSMFEETELLEVGDMDVYPLAVAVEVNKNCTDGNPIPAATNSLITKAVFEKEKGEFRVRVVKQILWGNGKRYELQEIYGIGNSVEGDLEGNGPEEGCVVCLSEPRDTTVLPCRHMCVCSGCAVRPKTFLGSQTDQYRCPICRQPVERLMQIKVTNESGEEFIA